MDITVAKEWSALLVPWAGMLATAFVALRVSRVATKITGVHDLVNSEMTRFRKVTEDFYKARESEVFQAGQQNVRDSQRSVTAAAAGATKEAAVATTAAAVATTAAIELTGLTTPAPPVP